MIVHNSNTIVDNLYYLLWLKDDVLRSGAFPVRIPDSLIISHGKVVNWYFSPHSGNGVLMKKPINLTAEDIYQSFTRRQSRSGIVAVFIENTQKNQDTDPLPKNDRVKFSIPEKEGNISIKYFTQEKLHDLLFSHLKDSAEAQDSSGETQQPIGNDAPQSCYSLKNKSGILQAFIDPYGDNNQVIQVIWSPQVSIYSKKVNLRSLFDTRYDPFERAATFDGPEAYSRSVSLRGKVISQEVRKFCQNIVHRIDSVTFQSIVIQRMVVYFKADSKNRLNFLYASSIRLQNERPKDSLQFNCSHTPLVFENNFIRPPEMKLTLTTNTMRPVALEYDVHCFYCSEMVQSKDLVAIPYEFIIDTFEANGGDILDQRFKRNSGIKIIEAINPEERQFVLHNKKPSVFLKDATSQIPEVIAKLYPRLSFEKYLTFRKNSKFLSQQIKLCQYCFLEFSLGVKTSGAPLKGVLDYRFMSKGLAKGSLFTREMKAIVAAKNVEMTEQKGSEFVKYQNKEVFQRMLDYLMEEMGRIAWEKNVKQPGSQRSSSSTSSAQRKEQKKEEEQKEKRFSPQKKLKVIRQEIEKCQELFGDYKKDQEGKWKEEVEEEEEVEFGFGNYQEGSPQKHVSQLDWEDGNHREEDEDDYDYDDFLIKSSPSASLQKFRNSQQPPSMVLSQLKNIQASINSRQPLQSSISQSQLQKQNWKAKLRPSTHSHTQSQHTIRPPSNAHSATQSQHQQQQQQQLPIYLPYAYYLEKQQKQQEQEQLQKDQELLHEQYPYCDDNDYTPNKPSSSFQQHTPLFVKLLRKDSQSRPTTSQTTTAKASNGSSIPLASPRRKVLKNRPQTCSQIELCAFQRNGNKIVGQTPTNFIEEKQFKDIFEEYGGGNSSKNGKKPLEQSQQQIPRYPKSAKLMGRAASCSKGRTLLNQRQHAKHSSQESFSESNRAAGSTQVTLNSQPNLTQQRRAFNSNTYHGENINMNSKLLYNEKHPIKSVDEAAMRTITDELQGEESDKQILKAGSKQDFRSPYGNINLNKDRKLFINTNQQTADQQQHYTRGTRKSLENESKLLTHEEYETIRKEDSENKYQGRLINQISNLRQESIQRKQAQGQQNKADNRGLINVVKAGRPQDLHGIQQQTLTSFGSSSGFNLEELNDDYINQRD